MGKTQVRFLFLAAIAAIVAAVLIALNPSGGGDGPASAQIPKETVADCSQRPSEVATGTDTFDSTAQLIIDLGPPGPFPIDLEGDTTVERYPDPQQPAVIDIEIIEMNLRSVSPVGITVTAGKNFGLPATTGEVASSSGYDDFPAESFFDVYIQVDASGMGGGIYHNNEPVRMEAMLNPDPEGIVCLPPYEHVYAPPITYVPVTLYEGETAVGTLDYAVHIPEPPRTITVVKLDEETEQPLPGAVFTLHEGAGCVPPAVGAATTDASGVGDLGPMGGGMYSVQEVIAPVGSELPANPCTDVDHTTPYDNLEVIDGGPDTMGGLDRFPTAAKVIMDITSPPIGEVTVVLNGVTEVERQPLISNTIETEIISMELTGNHPIAGQVILREHTVQHSYGAVVNPIIDDQGTPEPEDDILLFGDSFFDVYVEVDVPGMGAQWENSAPVPMQTRIHGIPPELAFFQSGPIAVPMQDRVTGLPVGVMNYALHITLPRGEKAVIMQDPAGPPQQISYSIEFSGPSNGIFHAADILNPGPVVARTCASLGLTAAGCAMASPQDDMNSLSYGYDFSSANPAEPPKVFSVDPASAGLLGTDVYTEATCPTGAEAHADLFRTPLNGTNQQEFDGNGVPGCLVSYPLGLVEPLAPPIGDNLNALGELPTGDPVYFTLAPASPSLTGLAGGPYTEAHIFKSTGGVVSVYATDADLGLVPGDVVDALSLRESDGLFDVNPADGVFDSPPDLLQFSLAPGSPTLIALAGLTPPASAADQFIPPIFAGGQPVRVTLANDHGLRDAFDEPLYGDNLDAMKAPRLDSDGDGVPDPIDVGVAAFDDGTISGSLAGSITVADAANSVQVEAPSGGGGGGVFATCPATASSDITDIGLTLAGGEVAVLGCESSASVTIVNGPASVGFGPFTATVPTGSKVIIRQLPSPAAGPCGGTVPAGAYQITHSVGTLNVIISSPSMSPVTLPPGSVYRDCDADAFLGVVDNCPDNPNPLQTNTDAALAIAGATHGLGIPLVGDTMGDVCDDEDDNDSGPATQDPGVAAVACPPGVMPLWADCVETYLGTVLGDNCKGAPGPGGDANPPDINIDGSVNILDVFPMFPFWLGPTPTGREDLNADGTVNILDVFTMFPVWLQTCS